MNEYAAIVVLSGLSVFFGFEIGRTVRPAACHDEAVLLQSGAHWSCDEKAALMTDVVDGHVLVVCSCPEAP